MESRSWGCIMEVSNETQEALEEIAEKKNKDIDTVVEKFKANYEEAEEQTNYGEDRLEKFALRITRSDVVSESRIPSNEVLIKTIGHNGFQNWNEYNDNGDVVGDKDVLIAYGLVDQNPNEETGREQVAAIIFDETDDVDLASAAEAFEEMGNEVVAEFNVGEADLNQYLMLNSVESTDLDVTEPDDETREEYLSDIRDEVQETTIENIADNLSAVERQEDGSEWPADFGVDMRVIEGDIVDSFKRDNGESRFGIYTIRDETMFDEEDIVGSVVHDSDADDQQTPGLTAWCDPDMMEYGSGSVCEFYGSITQGEDGQVTMNIFGINPIFEREFDGYEDTGGDGDFNNDDSEEETNVERTTI